MGRGPPVAPPERTAAVGHEDAFPEPRLSARCRFSQGTFAGTLGNGRDAPIPAVRCGSRQGVGRPNGNDPEAHSVR
jgi:hypothetical protein